MKVIYLPIEVSKRELVSKTFLATKLASEGYNVLLFRSDVFDRVGWPLNGVYIGKNCFRTEVPYSVEHHRKMKASGVTIWYLDEEGGIYIGNSEKEWRERVKHRVDPKDLYGDDRLLVWGEWQREVFSGMDGDVEIHVTGSPNYDIFQTKYHKCLNEFDDSQTKGMKDFILINTRFTLSNGLIKIKEHLGEYSPGSSLMSKSTISKLIALDGVMQFEFIFLAQTLAEKFPDKKIVIRPHPAESSETYKCLFEMFSNVEVGSNGDVGSWIRRAAVVIHNGCSTAIQAAIAGKPVITFMPHDEPGLIPGLANMIGTRANDAESVIKELENLNITNTDQWRRTISELDSIEKICDIISKNSCILPSELKKVDILKVLRCVKRFDKSEKYRSVVRFLAMGKSQKYELSKHQFDPEFFAVCPSIHKAACEYYSSAVKCEAISNNVYLFKK